MVFGRFLTSKTTLILTWVLAFLPLPFLVHKVGIWRIFLTKSVHSYAELKNQKRVPSLILTSCIGILFLLIDSTLCMDKGFLYSFLLSIFFSLSSGLFLRFSPGKRKMISFVFLILLLFPSFPSKNELSLFSPLRTMLFFPFVAPFCLLGVLGLFLPLPGALNVYASFLMNMAKLWERIDICVPFLYPEGAFYFHFFFLAIFLLMVSLGFHFWGKISIFLYVTPLLFLNLFPSFSFLTKEVTFLNVGQGDAILIREGRTTVLIDTGGTKSFDLAEETLIPFFKTRGIKKLDCVIITHGDFDHDGALPSLYDSFLIKDIVREEEEFPLKVGSLTFNNLNIYGGEDENSKSLVLYLENFLNRDFLFMGDAPIEIEKKILDDNESLKADVLKIGHHGSITSSSLEFLKAIEPDEAIISVGKGNSYGHPDNEVLKRLQDLDIKIRRTDEEGTITYFGFI